MEQSTGRSWTNAAQIDDLSRRIVVSDHETYHTLESINSEKFRPPQSQQDAEKVFRTTYNAKIHNEVGEAVEKPLNPIETRKVLEAITEEYNPPLEANCTLEQRVNFRKHFQDKYM